MSAIATELEATFATGDASDGRLFSLVAEDAVVPLNGLVYAVGTINLRSLQRLTEADFLNDFRVNAMGAALAIQAALPALKKSTGIASVVLFSSVAALQGFAFHGSIGMAKGAVNGLTLADEAGLKDNSPVQLALRDKLLVVVPIRQPAISLDALLAQVTTHNLHSEVQTGPGVGGEAW